MEGKIDGFGQDLKDLRGITKGNHKKRLFDIFPRFSYSLVALDYVAMCREI